MPKITAKPTPATANAKTIASAAIERPRRRMPPLPAIGSEWSHRNGNRYKVLLITNLHSEDLRKYPVTVCYRGPNGRTWSRRLNRWHGSMTLVSRATRVKKRAIA